MADFLLHWQSWVGLSETVWPASLKYLLSVPLRKSLLTAALNSQLYLNNYRKKKKGFYIDLHVNYFQGILFFFL